MSYGEAEALVLARDFHEMLALYRWIGCGWQFAATTPDGQPLCPCPAIAKKYLEKRDAEADRVPDVVKGQS